MATINRAMQLAEYGGPECLRIVDLPIPTPGPGEVRVRVLASSVNYTETLIRQHLYPQTSAYKLPFVMGYDVVGEIDQVHPDVTQFKVGDRVADMTVVGSDATYRLLKAKDLTIVPPDIDPAEAATLILSWTTAYQMLHRSAKVRVSAFSSTAQAARSARRCCRSLGSPALRPGEPQTAGTRG